MSVISITSPEVLDFKKDILPLREKLRFPLTYDYMFTASFQRNPYALKGFLAAILGLHPDGITSLEIMNPMDRGRVLDDKDIILDVKACLNNKFVIDIEMQVTHYDYLPERFLYQICRAYSGSLPKGENYHMLPPVLHIAIMDTYLFPKGDPRNTDEFFSEYYIMSTKDHRVYSRNFRMEVVSLKNIENAADKEDPNGVYRWARLFKAATWKEFNMIAEKNSYMESLATSVCALCNDPKFVAECERRLLNELEYNSRMEEASRKGWDKGWNEGRDKGWNEGREEGWNEGQNWGKAEGILQLLADLGDIPEELKAKIISQKDTDLLNKWLKAAAHAESTVDFIRKAEIHCD